MLCKDGSQASWCVGGAGGCVGDQGILAIQPWESHDWLGDELLSEGHEGGLGLLGQWSPFVSGVLPGEFEEWCRDDCKVLDVGPEEIA